MSEANGHPFQYIREFTGGENIPGRYLHRIPRYNIMEQTMIDEVILFLKPIEMILSLPRCGYCKDCGLCKKCGKYNKTNANNTPCGVYISLYERCRCEGNPTNAVVKCFCTHGSNNENSDGNKSIKAEEPLEELAPLLMTDYHENINIEEIEEDDDLPPLEYINTEELEEID